MTKKVEKEQLKINLESLVNDTAEKKIELLNSLASEDIADIYIKYIVRLIADEDKGVRNATSMLILSNRNPRFPYFLLPYIKSEVISVRNLAGEILIKLGSLSVDPIIQFDCNNNVDYLKFLIDILGLIGDQRAALYVMGVLSSTDNENVILACIEALGNMCYRESVDVLMLFYDRNELFKPTVVEALGKMGSREALGFLISRFTEEDELTKYSILESLGKIGDMETYFFLIEQTNDIGGTLTLPLITSISTLREKYNLDIPFDNRMKKLLLYALNEGTLENKKSTFALIDSFDDKDILYTSLCLLGQDYELDDMIKSKILYNTDYIFSEITRIISDKPQNLRHVLSLFLEVIRYAEESQTEIKITELGLKNIIYSASSLLSHHDEEIRKLSMEILFKLDAESALLFIDSMLNDENPWNRMGLLEILERMPAHQSESAIQKLTEDPDEMVRERAQFASASILNNETEKPN
ncbi:MAG: HEAT repeat domain-containing protein [Bacteroidota bacterium]